MERNKYSRVNKTAAFQTYCNAAAVVVSNVVEPRTTKLENENKHKQSVMHIIIVLYVLHLARLEKYQQISIQAYHFADGICLVRHELNRNTQNINKYQYKI